MVMSLVNCYVCMGFLTYFRWRLMQMTIEPNPRAKQAVNLISQHRNRWLWGSVRQIINARKV